MNKPTTINEYISVFPQQVQTLLLQVRNTIQQTAPKAKEAIKYGIPTFVFDGKNLVHFGAFTNHIGFYPTPSGIDEFEDELSNYKRAKGSVQFPLDKPIPFDLIQRIVLFRVDKNEAKTNLKIKRR